MQHVAEIKDSTVEVTDQLCTELFCSFSTRQMQGNLAASILSNNFSLLCHCKYGYPSSILQNPKIVTDRFP